MPLAATSRQTAPMLTEWVLLTGAFTGTVAVVTTARSTSRHVAARRRRDQLAEWLKRALRIQARLSALAAELDDYFVAGVTWAGYEIWPFEVRGHIYYLDGLIDEAERNEAAVRALDTDGANERLRADVEQLYVLFRMAATQYLDGSRACYQDSGGAPLEVGAAGRDLIGPVMHDNGAAEVRAARASFTTLARSCLYRLELEWLAETLEVRWPIQRRDKEAAHGLNVWASEPRPISHVGLEQTTEEPDG